jgi:glycosyltransferase involved in cell wall biosynthesis
MFKRVSWSIVGWRHVHHLKKLGMHIEEVEERTIPTLYLQTHPFLIFHPFFYPFQAYERSIKKSLPLASGVIGIDVADSDRISEYAVHLTEYADALIVPSEFSRKSFLNSGVRKPVYAIPHGLDEEFYELPPNPNPYFGALAKKKSRENLVYAVFFLQHSDYRKGFDLVLKWYQKLKKERSNVLLIVITPVPYVSGKKFGGINIYGWFGINEKIALYDLADIYPLFSRGGGFEMCGLEALSRKAVVIAPKGGSWAEYLPKFSLVKSHRCSYVLKDNPIHVGGGVEIDVDKAVDKAVDIVDNLHEYKQRTWEYVQQIKSIYNWDNVAFMLKSVIEKTFKLD